MMNRWASVRVRLTRLPTLLKMVLEDNSISLGTVLERLCSDEFISERHEIVAAAVYVKSGEEGQASRFANVIAKLAGLGMGS